MRHIIFILVFKFFPKWPGLEVRNFKLPKRGYFWCQVVEFPSLIPKIYISYTCPMEMNCADILDQLKINKARKSTTRYDKLFKNLVILPNIRHYLCQCPKFTKNNFSTKKIVLCFLLSFQT